MMTRSANEGTGVSSKLHQELSSTLVHEALLLDERRFDEWLQLLADDISYVVPMRVQGDQATLEGSFNDSSYYFEDDLRGLKVRLGRFNTTSAWSEHPPSRTRHFISNIVVNWGSQSDELSVSSYLLFTRCRGSSPQVDVLTGTRQDVWRLGPNRWQLARRRVFLDQAVLGTLNLSTIY